MACGKKYQSQQIHNLFRFIHLPCRNPRLFLHQFLSLEGPGQNWAEMRVRKIGKNRIAGKGDFVDEEEVFRGAERRVLKQAEVSARVSELIRAK
jgi:hypothetical protein